MPIIINPPGKKAVRVDRSRFSHEADLQVYLRDNPLAIPLEELKEDSKLVVLERESPTPVGPIDLLAADQNGELFILETKLYRNPDKRQVVAQTLDYGAALWSCADDPDAWLEGLEKRLGPGKLHSILETEFQDAQAALEGMRNSLENGIYSFMILMDQVPAALKNLIHFINANSQFKVYAVELEYYNHEEYKILIPHLFGAEIRAKSNLSKTGLRRTWDEAAFFARLKELLKTDQVGAIRKVYEAACSFADEVAWGTGRDVGSFNPKVFAISNRSLFTVNMNGILYLNYSWLDDDEHALECRKLYQEKLRVIPPFKAAMERSRKKYPPIKAADWVPHTAEFIHILEEFVRECREDLKRPDE